MTRKDQLSFMVNLIDNSTKGSVELDDAINFAKNNGIEADMHVGKEKEWFNQDRNNRVAEWLMGQFISGHERNQYIGFNSGINISMSFLEGTY